ncbi:hypothetical protein CHS0354_008504 [Potamilus streckersoni]|uniref:Uncharacterized protein n=1 Tax=Potamilus streckersoni TaxID=2493646 RepID=A0AAE0S7T7_9BIVA|nr:hypothetical protein CHS0354_008504 [Potamilus streckersoni]
MAGHETLLQTSEFKNYLSVLLAFRFLAKELQKCVDIKLKEIHREIYTKCSVYQPCQHDCSEQEKGTLSWCKTCSEWRTEILKHVKNGLKNKIHWDKMHSREWPDNYSMLGKIFAHEQWEEGRLNDVPSCLAVLESCNDFILSYSISNQIREIRNARNTHIGHNASLKLKESDKERVFATLKQFATDFFQADNALPLIQNFQNIENGIIFKSNHDVANDIQMIEGQIQLVQPDKDTNERLQDISNDVATLEATMIPYSKNVANIRSDRIFGWTRIWIVYTMILLLAFQFPRTGKDAMTGCLTEDFSHPLQPEVHMSHYISEHQDFVGRQWLLQNISEIIFNDDFYHTGVLLVADMGFGKSALVSHIVCPDSHQSGAKLRAKLLAYHICRFDALITKRADLFIRRLAGMIANLIPQFGSVLETEYGVLSYLNSTKCNYDPVGCMDQSIVFLLSKIELSIDKNQRMIVLIDGLDECEDTENNINKILDVLEQTTYRFPDWIKFIFTTRNIPRIISTMGDFYVIQVSANDTRNGKDIYDFLERHLEKDETTVKKLLKAWVLDEKTKVINKLVGMSAGNFLYIHHALKYMKSKEILSIENIPNSLDKIYKLNFERIYGKRKDRFQFAKKILEVLSASRTPMTKERIFKILNSEYKNLSREVYDEEMHFLSHFVTNTADNSVFFIHITIYHWLTDIKRKGTKYFIDPKKGHYFMAKYLLSIVKVTNNINIADIIDLTVHVSESKREELVTGFKALPPELFNSSSRSTSLLHELASKVNSYFATGLCLHFIKEVDSRNNDDITPAFIAAGKGNNDTLQALLDAGADISFRRQLPDLSGSLEDAVLITKTRTFWGYGLLDIAAQHGHIDTVLLILGRNRSFANVMNEMNVRPHHLACEFGHIEVLDSFIKIGVQVADQRCLYNAASNGHTNIVRKLLNLGVKDSCVPCNGSIYWVSANENRLQAETRAVNIPNDMLDILILQPKRKPFDDWWTISCETALHAASRLGFTDIVQMLTAQGHTGMSCRDRAGRTPFLTAIIHNRTEAISILYPLANVSDKCQERDLTHDEITQLSKLEIQKLSEGKCPNGSSLAHLISRYGLSSLPQSSLFYALDWEEIDDEGSRPIHHAACHSGLEMILTLSKDLRVDLFSHTSNGSTAYHLAALCRPFNLMALHGKSYGRLPQLYDNMNRSILQYMYISPLPSASNVAVELDVMRKLMMERHFSAEDITHVDSIGANILHSIIGKGYFASMISVYLKYQDEFLRLIRKNNSFNMNPLDEAFYNLPNDTLVLKKLLYNLKDEELLETFSNISDMKYFISLSPIEISISYFVRIVSEHSEHHQFRKYVHDAIKKSNVFVTRMFLLYMKARHVLDYRGYSPLHTFMSIGINPIMGQIFLANSSEIIRCGMPLEKSPLHQISLNIKNKFWFVDSAKMGELLEGVKPADLEQCFDTESYNVLHRAVEGGNYKLAEFFIGQGLKFIEKDRLISIYTMLGAMAKYSFYKPSLEQKEFEMFHGQNLGYAESGNMNYDMTLLLILSRLNGGGYLTYNHICNTSTATLSLVHLAAANGLKKSLEYISNNWGRSDI